MFVFIKKIFCIGSLFLSSTTPLSCISIKNQECKELMKRDILNGRNNVNAYVD